MPDPATWPYTFDRIADVIERFLALKGFERYGLFVQDYGGPVGFRIVARHPEALEWLIIQNSNAYEVGFTAAWDGLRNALWKNRTPETEQPLLGFLTRDTIKTIYLHGAKRPELVSPDNWESDVAFMQRPHAVRLNLDLFYDYRTNVPLYPEWQAFLRQRQPETIIFWGQDDIFFTTEGGDAYLADLPRRRAAPARRWTLRGRGPPRLHRVAHETVLRRERGGDVPVVGGSLTNEWSETVPHR